MAESVDRPMSDAAVEAEKIVSDMESQQMCPWVEVRSWLLQAIAAHTEAAVKKSEMRGDRREAEMAEQRDLAYTKGDEQVRDLTARLAAAEEELRATISERNSLRMAHVGTLDIQLVLDEVRELSQERDTLKTERDAFQIENHRLLVQHQADAQRVRALEGAVEETLGNFEREDDDGLHCGACEGAGLVHRSVCPLLPLIALTPPIAEIHDGK